MSHPHPLGALPMLSSYRFERPSPEGSPARPDDGSLCLARIGCALPAYALPVTKAMPVVSDRIHCCDLCGSELGADHDHLLERRSQRLLCSCQVCAALLEQGPGRRYRRVPRRIAALPVPRIEALDSDGRVESATRWPVSFFSPRLRDQRLSVSRAGPEGVRHDALPMGLWYRLSDANPALRSLRPEVETLLLCRTGQGLAGWRVPVDRRCGLIGQLRLQGDSRERVQGLLEDFVTRLELESRVQNPESID